jgi:hypothetical protein
VGGDVVLGERFYQEFAALRVRGFGADDRRSGVLAGELVSDKVLEDVADPAGGERLPATGVCDRRSVTGDECDAKVRAEPLRCRLYVDPALAPVCEGVEVGSGDRPGVVVIDEQTVGEAFEDGAELSAAALGDGRAERVILSFEIDGTGEDAEAVCNRTRLIVHATSLGGVETLIERRARYSSEVAAGTPATPLRVSDGIEDIDDLWHDLERALDR